MKFTVEWQVLVSDASDDPEGVDDQKPFEIEADSVEAARLSSMSMGSDIIAKERGDAQRWCMPHIVALIDEKGERHQLSARITGVTTGMWL